MSSANATAMPSDAAFEQAADWAARMESGAMSSADESALRAWLASDPTHAAALARMQGILQATAGQALPAGNQQKPAALRWTRVVLPLAASLALVAVLAQLMLPISTMRIDTPAGEHRTVELADGSIVHLNAKSRLDVAFGWRERKVTLDYGEALFEVASHPVKPFSVYSQGVQVRALGTAFNVQSGPEETTVTLLHGEVQVSRDVAATAGGEQAAVPVTTEVSLRKAGQQVACRKDNLEMQVIDVDVDRVTAWRERKIFIERAPLRDLVYELNRYFPGHIRVDDPALAAMTVNVSLSIDEREVTLHRLERLLPISFVPVSRTEAVVVPRQQVTPGEQTP
jgi:transmembrane sensor